MLVTGEPFKEGRCRDGNSFAQGLLQGDAIDFSAELKIL